MQSNSVRDEFGRTIEPSSKFVMLRPILNLYKGQLNGNKFRNRLSDLSLHRDIPSYRMVRELVEWMTKEAAKMR